MSESTERERMLEKQLEDARLEIRLLRQKLDALARRLFGKKSEQLSPAQLQLLFQEMEAPGPAMGKESGPEESETQPLRSNKPKRQRAPRIPENLPVVEDVLVPEVVQAEPSRWRKIGEEVSEQIDFEPAKFFRRRLVRPKYVHRSEVDAVPVVAALPPVLQERCIAAPGLIAQILVSKYADHMPLYRQESIYESRHGVSLPRQSMARWVGLAADWLRPIYDEIRNGVFEKGYVQVDETPIRYLDPGRGKTGQGYLWTCLRPDGDVFYRWETSRAAECLKRVIPVDFDGKLQCDGYEGYPCFAKKHAGKLVLVGCWAHVRRAFFEAQTEAPKLVGFILRQIQLLYAVEKELKEAKAVPRLKEARRAAQSVPVLKRLHRVLVLLKTKRTILPQSGFGKAIRYALGQWESVLVYAGEGRVEIDNNPCERAIRPTAVGKKNWLFFGEADAGERSAIVYTIIESCRRRGIDPYAYLRDVLTRLPSMTNWQIKELVPEAWAKAQRGVAAKAA
ncbi:MAG: IS66 family transposase [Verrucomicrobiota bacterium]